MRHVCFRVAVAVSVLASRPLAAQQVSLDSAGLATWLDSLLPRALKKETSPAPS